MSYIGNQPAESYASFEKQVFTIVNSQTAYTLSHSVVNENDIRLVVNNVVQEPGSGKAYTASGTTLTLSAALVNGTDEMYCVYLGRALQTVNPPNASVGLSQLSATGTKDATTFLRGDNTFASAGGNMTPAFEAYKIDSSQSLSDNVWTKMTLNSETYDTDNAFDSSTNYRFTPQTAGKYFFYTRTTVTVSTYNDLRNTNAKFYKNGSAIAQTEVYITPYGSSVGGTALATMTQAVIDMNGSTDYVESYIRGNGLNSTNISAENNTFGGYKIIE